MNEVFTSDEKYIQNSIGNYSFLNTIQNPFWQSSKYIEKETVSLDGGITFIETTDELILGIYFFVHDYRIENYRNIYNLLQVITEIGGLATSLLVFVGAIGTIYNYYVYVMHFVYLLYFVRETDDE
jgi:hypothetical protein